MQVMARSSKGFQAGLREKKRKVKKRDQWKIDLIWEKLRAGELDHINGKNYKLEIVAVTKRKKVRRQSWTS